MSSGGSPSTEQRGPMQRKAVLEDMLRSLPPEVASQVEEIEREPLHKPPPPKPLLQRSRTQALSGGESMPTGAPSDITLQKRCASLEGQLDKWVGIAQLLASELAYREKRLWDWQMDNTNTKVILQKFKDRLKKGDGDGKGLGNPTSAWGKKFRGPLALNRGNEAVETTKAGESTPRQIPTSAAGIGMLIVEPDRHHQKALAETCSSIGYKVSTCDSGEDALALVSTHQGGGSSSTFGSICPYELILCDVELPGIPGVEVLNQLRATLRTEVSIIMLASDMTGQGAEMVERCIVEGADSYILKPAALKELTALWGFVARRRQHNVEQSSQMADLNQVIRSVEEELGTANPKDSKQSGKAGSPSLAIKGGAANMAAAAFADVGGKKPGRKAVRWSMHEQFEEDLKADLADAHKRDLPTGGSSALTNPKFEKGVDAAVSQLLEVIAPGSTELIPGEKGSKGEKGKGKSKKLGPKRAATAPGGLGGAGAGDEADAEGDEPPKPELPPRKPMLRKGDSGNLRKMLLERRKTSTGRSSQELLHMLNILEGDEEADDGSPDELVLCRLCEQQVLRSSLQLHTAVCKAAHKAKSDDEAVNREVKELLALLASTRRQALLSLITIAVQRHILLCGPLDKLVDLGGQLLKNDDTELSPLHHLGRLTELARELAQLKRSGGSELGGSVFYSCASQLKSIIAEKIGHVQELIDLDPHALDHGHVRPLRKGSGATGKLGIKDFSMIRLLASGGFAQVWLAKKKSTGDVMAVKAMRKEHLRNTDQVTSINVEHAILAKHDSDFLVRAFYSFRSAHHVYFALEYMPGGDLSSMLAECGCIAEPSASFYVAETLLGMHYLHTKRILHRDIKPSNVLLASSGHIKLADFGLSTSMMQHKKCGTLPYVAPEVLRDGSASEALDHWATGVLLYELIAGEPPFRGDTPKQMLQNILETTLDTRPLSNVSASLVRSLLNVDPSLRLGASGFEEIQGHAFFAFTQWDNMMLMTPPFVPQLEGDEDDSYFPRALETADDIDGSDSSDDSDSESFKKIQSVNVDHLISLARRPSGRSSFASATQSAAESPLSSSTPTQATPPSASRPLKTGAKNKSGLVAGGSRPASRAITDKVTAGPSQNMDARRPASQNFS